MPGSSSPIADLPTSRSGRKPPAVGAALALRPEDHIFGSHRSHGEFIAKGLAAIERLDRGTLLRIMEKHQDGRPLRAVERHVRPSDDRRLAEAFLLFGLLAEIFMRSTGFNGGMGGSMHAFFPPFGAYPNNAIVGASAGIATGAALYKKLAGEKSIAVANIGDGATGCGPVWEAMNFAAMAQYDRLWPKPFKGGLPVLFFFANNFYAMGGQTIGETTGWDRLARIGVAMSPSNLHAETVDGANPLAVADAVERNGSCSRAGAALPSSMSRPIASPDTRPPMRASIAPGRSCRPGTPTIRSRSLPRASATRAFSTRRRNRRCGNASPPICGPSPPQPSTPTQRRRSTSPPIRS